MEVSRWTRSWLCDPNNGKFIVLLDRRNPIMKKKARYIKDCTSATDLHIVPRNHLLEKTFVHRHIWLFSERFVVKKNRWNIRRRTFDLVRIVKSLRCSPEFTARRKTAVFLLRFVDRKRFETKRQTSLDNVVIMAFWNLLRNCDRSK